MVLSETIPVSSIRRTSSRRPKTHAYESTDSPYHTIGGDSKKTPVACAERSCDASSASRLACARSRTCIASCSRRFAHRMCSTPSPVKIGGMCVWSSSLGAFARMAIESSSDGFVLATRIAWMGKAPTVSGMAKNSVVDSSISIERSSASSFPRNAPG